MVSRKQFIGFSAEKEQTNTLIGIIYILAIAVAVGTVFFSTFPELGEQTVSIVSDKFQSLLAENDSD